MDINEIRTLPIDTALRYVGPIPAKDAPSWMRSPVMYRRVVSFGSVEVFTTSGTERIPAEWLAPITLADLTYTHTGFEAGAL